MKKFRHYALLLVTAMAVFGCSKDYDDTELKQDISDLQSRVEKLETWCISVGGVATYMAKADESNVNLFI